MRRSTNRSVLLAASALVAAAGCATVSPASRIESRLVDLGVSPARADCLADELQDNLGRADLSDIADFLDDVGDADSAGGAVDALRRIDNPQAAAAVAAAAISCAFGG